MKGTQTYRGGGDPSSLWQDLKLSRTAATEEKMPNVSRRERLSLYL